MEETKTIYNIYCPNIRDVEIIPGRFKKKYDNTMDYFEIVIEIPDVSYCSNKAEYELHVKRHGLIDVIRSKNLKERNEINVSEPYIIQKIDDNHKTIYGLAIRVSTKNTLENIFYLKDVFMTYVFRHPNPWGNPYVEAFSKIVNDINEYVFVNK